MNIRINVQYTLTYTKNVFVLHKTFSNVHRPSYPLPYRPLSAGPVLHRHYHHSSLRHLEGSQNRLAPTKTVGTNTPVKGVGGKKSEESVLSSNKKVNKNYPYLILIYNF